MIGVLRNVGHGIRMDINTTNAEDVNISSGPLSYLYRAYEIKFHYANNDSKGSEHTINGNHFVGEVSTLNFTIVSTLNISWPQHTSEVPGTQR